MRTTATDEQVRAALGYHLEVNSIVILTWQTRGSGMEDDERRVPAGSAGLVTDLFMNDHGLNVEVLIETKEPLEDDTSDFIINVFSQDDPSPFPFKPAREVAPRYMVAAKMLQRIREEVQAHDDKLDDRANGGQSARAPTGDDYNVVVSIVQDLYVPDRVRDAAAEMLAALRRMLQCGSMHDDGTFVVELRGEGGLIGEAEAAVAKAEGRANG